MMAHGARFAERRRRNRHRRFRRFGLALLGAGALFAIGWVIWATPLLGVRQVEVIGAHRVTISEVSLLADVPLGTPMVRVNTGAIDRRVESLPAIAQVLVTRVWPNTLRITVDERQPAAALKSSSGWRLFSSDGVDLGPVTAAPKGLPVITQVDGIPDAAAIRTALTVLATLPSPVAVLVLTVSASSPDDVRLALAGGATVVWGSASDSDVKAAVLAALLRHPAKEYDVSAPDSPTTR